MNVVFRVILSALVYNSVETVPPEACFAEFNWGDCGQPPTPVIYYWKLGSRCEVAMWRGCLPNMNMFENQYECVSTCIFTARAMPEDYHQHNEIDADIDILPTTTAFVNGTVGGDVTTSRTEGTGGSGDGGNSTGTAGTGDAGTETAAAAAETTVAPAS